MSTLADNEAIGAHEREKALLQRQEVYRQILDAIADMVLVKGEDSRILWANKAFRDYYGMSNEQLRDIVDAPFNKPDYTQQYVRDDSQVFSIGRDPGDPRRARDASRRLGAALQYRQVSHPRRGPTVRMTVGVSRNITETKRIQEDSQRYREQLERDRLAARSPPSCRAFCSSTACARTARNMCRSSARASRSIYNMRARRAR